MIVFHSCEQGSEAWHQLRKNLWTGSRAIKLLQGKRLPDDSSDYQNAAMKRGSLLESVAIREYERQVGHKVKRPGFVTNSVYWNAGYSPDAICCAHLLEVKALNGERHDKLAAGDIPLEYLVQIYFGMIITGKRKANLLAFNPECEQQLTVLEVAYDKVIGNNIRRKLRLDMKSRLLTSTSVSDTM